MDTQHETSTIWSALQQPARWLSRRRFLGGLGGATLLAIGGSSGVASARVASPPLDLAAAMASADVATLPPLPYGYNALEPHIDELTMMLHHMRHHAAYVATLNTTLEKYPDLQKRSVTDLLVNIHDVPEAIRTTVRNNGGGHSNHSIFWAIMAPNAGGEPSGALAQAITSTFGSFATFKEKLTAAASGRFGSGWGWLVLTPKGTLEVVSMPNQDSPYMMGMTPLVGVDVWEHAYYLKYMNRRADYLAAWWNVVNWDAVAMRYMAARG